MMVTDIDRFQFEARFHSCVEFQHWEHVQRLKTARARRSSTQSGNDVTDSEQRPPAKPELRKILLKEKRTSDDAFIRKVKAKPTLNILSKLNQCQAQKSVTFMLPRDHEMLSEKEVFLEKAPSP